MRKREQGILTIEASIVLTFCLLFILFLFGFARVYNAQSTVSHAVLQSTDAIALESYLREETLHGSESDVTELANRFLGTTSISADSYKSLRSADVSKIAKEKFIYALGKNKTEANNKLKKLGIKNGVDGIDFSASKIDLGNDDVIVYVKYIINMQFPLFGMDEISVTKAAKSKTFGDILFDIETVPEDPIMGSALGGGNYKFGTKIEISATPNYGYKFLKWSDGSVENPRTVTVAGAHKYVAVFEQSEFGVNLVSSPVSGGSTSGAGVYKYLDSATITALPATGYHFSKWSIYHHKDKKNKIITSQTTILNIDQSYTCTAQFDRNLYSVNVETSGTTSGKAYIVYNSTNNTSITAPYQAGYKLFAPSIEGYRFLGWKEKGASSYLSTSLNVHMNVPAENMTYVACYESILRTVSFYNYDGSIYATRQVASGQSLGINMPQNPKSIGKKFSGWKNFNSTTPVNNNMDIYGNWTYCKKHRLGDCGFDHAVNITFSWHAAGNKTVKARCCVCADCGILLNGNDGKSPLNKPLGNYYGGTNISSHVWCTAHISSKDGKLYADNTVRYNSAGSYYIHDFN